MKLKTKNNSLAKWIALATLVLALPVGLYFGWAYYQDYKANKIYSSNEAVSFSDFDFEVTKAQFKPVDLQVNQKYLNKHGGLDKQEDCSLKSKERTYEDDLEFPSGPSEYNLCHRHNDIKIDAQKYIENNQQLVIKYAINSKASVDAKNISFKLTPDGGRNVSKEGVYLGGFQKDANEEFYEDHPLTGETHYMLFGSPTYSQKPLIKSELKGDINKDLKRTGRIKADIRNSENTVDLKVTYKNSGDKEVRIIRINK